MRELVGGKNTIGRTTAVLKKPQKATFTFTFYSGRTLRHTMNILYEHNHAEQIAVSIWNKFLINQL